MHAISSLRSSFSPIRAAVLGAAALAAGCTSTGYDATGDDIVIEYGLGGFANPIFERYNDFASSGRRVVVDGQVISADAIAAFAMPDMCYTHNAVWSPHAFSQAGLVPDYEVTRYVASYLPEALERWFLNHHSSLDWIGIPEVGYDALVEIWPEGSCDPVEIGLAKFEAKRARDVRRLR